MENRLNDRFLNSVSNKLYKGSFILQYIYNKMLNSQNIRRYLYYNTINPLSSKGRDYAGNVVSQPDVDENQIKDLLTDLPFGKEMSLDLENRIFINLPIGNFDNKNELVVDVNIIVPITYYKVTEGYRNIQIACEVANEIADKYIDGDFMGDLGDGLKIKFVTTHTERLSKTNEYLWTLIRFKVSQPNAFDRVKY